VSEQTPEQTADREDTEAGSYVDLQSEVDKTFAGSWEQFLKAVRNPAEILYFVLWRHCEGKADKVEAWANEKKLPPDWLPRFYGMLTHKGDFRPDAATCAPDAEPEPVADAAEKPTP
jgi:hypothetical protein